MGYQAQSQPPIQPTGGYGGYQPYPPAGAAPQSQGYGYGYQQSSTPAHTQTQAPYAFQGSNPNPASQWNMDHSHNAGGSGGGYGRDRGPDRTWGGQAASREYPGYGGGGGGGDRGDRGDRKGKKTVQCKFWLNKEWVSSFALHFHAAGVLSLLCPPQSRDTIRCPETGRVSFQR